MVQASVATPHLVDDGPLFEVGKLLESKETMLWPYAKGLYSDNLLPTLWALLSDSGDASRLFWMRSGPPMAWADFAHAMSQVLLLIPQDKASGDMMGCVFLDNIMGSHRGSVNIWMRKRYRGQRTREVLSMALDYAFALFPWEAVWAMTIWRGTVRLGEDVGAKQVATLPGYAAGSRDVYVLKAERATWQTKQA